YQLSFWWAGAQETTRTGPTTETWQVSLGDETQSTPVVTNASQGFTGWMHQTMTFTATSAGEVLSFLAVGTPTNGPPVSLLDGVSLQAVVRDPSSVSLMVVAGLVSGIVGLRRRAGSTAA